MVLRFQWEDSQIFCRGFELHIKKDGSQLKGTLIYLSLTFLY
ncbi:hypothetical protein T03_5951 [Trichinella britovi]|uniref:Uncharacterized protein n=1 Tax=Trichinella britovi TaxID=45882 RepID=A0A0V0Z3W8_TRIBR|nr:hypothetical protein T03_5951 [Trichinella britovi]